MNIMKPVSDIAKLCSYTGCGEYNSGEEEVNTVMQ